MRQRPSLSRRSFLGWSAASTGALLVPTVWGRSLPVDHARSGGRVLVLLELAGGNDGLNMLVPHTDDRYHRARGALAIPGNQVLKLDDQVGLHPELTNLKELYDRGLLAVVEGVGYPDPVRSHFLSTDIWHTADRSGRRVDTGWAGRLADRAFEGDRDPNLMVSVGSKVPYACCGAEHRAVALSSPAGYRIFGGAEQVRALDGAVGAADPADAMGETSSTRTFLQQAYADARASSDSVREALAGYKSAAAYGNGELASGLRLVAALLAGGLSTRIFHLKMGGFDTHSGQANRHRQLMRTLNQGLSAFQQDLEHSGHAERTLVLAYSEFGRRVQANASGGTDHGTAGPVFLLSQNLNGGLYGARPDLSNLDDNGDLKFSTDFRRIYGTVTERWMGVPAVRVLGADYPPLDFLS